MTFPDNVDHAPEITLILLIDTIFDNICISSQAEHRIHNLIGEDIQVNIKIQVGLAVCLRQLSFLGSQLNLTVLEFLQHRIE